MNDGTVGLFVFPQVLKLFRDAAAAGRKNRECLRVIEYIEKLAGIDTPPVPAPASKG